AVIPAGGALFARQDAVPVARQFAQPWVRVSRRALARDDNAISRLKRMRSTGAANVDDSRSIKTRIRSPRRSFCCRRSGRARWRARVRARQEGARQRTDEQAWRAAA